MDTLVRSDTAKLLPTMGRWTRPESAWRRRAPASPLEVAAAGFGPTGLDQMEAVALLSRTDTKFVMPVRDLVRALRELRQEYWILSIDGRRIHHYRTLYFDSPDFELYTAHVNRRAERYKVRSREYAGSHMSFVEIKHHTRKGLTVKERLCTARPEIEITPEVRGWLQAVSPLDGCRLEPKLWNTYYRLTLVGRRCAERVTLDVDVAFCFAGRELRLAGLAIAEVKRAAVCQESPFLSQMRAQRVHPRSFSKYAFGVSELWDEVKHNAVKPQRLWIEKMMKGSV